MKLEWLVKCARGPQVAHAFQQDANLSVCGQVLDRDQILSTALSVDRRCKRCVHKLNIPAPQA